MSFDVDNQRCEMALAINCKDGDRPDWKPPDNCKLIDSNYHLFFSVSYQNWIGQGKTKETTTTTKKASTNKSGKTDASAPIATTKAYEMKENDKCQFKGLLPDKDNCQSN